jgi:outer membrane autotransporter protein
MKALFLAGAASFLAAPAFAGPYVEIENNSGFTGSDFEGAVTETHVGYEADLGENAGWYVQGGPAFVSPDAGETTTELSGKVGVGADLNENIGIYAEIAAQTQDEINFDEDLNIGTKVGIRYTF